jgi:hypothetical protein
MRLSWTLLLIPGCGLVPDQYTSDGERACDPRTLYYEDIDGDGAGNPRSVYVGCAPPAGYVDNDGDCDDLEPDFTTECGPADSGG